MQLQKEMKNEVTYRYKDNYNCCVYIEHILHTQEPYSLILGNRKCLFVKLQKMQVISLNSLKSTTANATGLKDTNRAAKRTVQVDSAYSFQAFRQYLAGFFLDFLLLVESNRISILFFIERLQFFEMHIYKALQSVKQLQEIQFLSPYQHH